MHLVSPIRSGDSPRRASSPGAAQHRSVAGDGRSPGLSKPFGDRVWQAHGLDAGWARVNAGGVQSRRERGVELARWIGWAPEVVRPVGDNVCAAPANIRLVEISDDENRIFGTQAKERGDRDERVRDGPVLDRCLEAAEVRKRLRVREHGLRMASRVEGKAQPVEPRLESHPVSLAEAAPELSNGVPVRATSCRLRWSSALQWLPVERVTSLLPGCTGYYGDLNKHPAYELGADCGSNWVRLREVGRVDLVETREVVEVGKMDKA